MSTDWTLHCTDCDKKPDFEIYGSHILQSVYKLREHIFALQDQDDSGYLEVHIMGHYTGDLWPFLREHRDHTIELMTKYGEPFPMDKEGNLL